MPHSTLRRSSASLLLLAVSAAAQFTQLTATDDGNTLYFTSPLLLQGETAASSPAGSSELRLFRLRPDGVSLFMERGPLASPNAGGSGAGVQAPQVSGDGSAVAFTFTFVCLVQPCVQTTSESELRAAQLWDLGQGTVQMSRNARWAVLTNQTTDFSSAAQPVTTTTSTLVELAIPNFTPTSVPPPPPGALHTVASDGTLLVQPPGGAVSLWKQGGLTPVPLPAGPAGRFLLSDDASTLLFTGSWSPDFGMQPLLALIAENLASGLRALLYLAPPDNSLLPVLMAASNDARTVLYRLAGPTSFNGPAYIVSSATGQTVPIPLPDGEFVSDGTLTGAGDIAFLATTAGRIVRFTLATGALSTVLPATPYCDASSPVAAGSYTRLGCTLSGSPADLQFKLVIGGFPAPVFDTAPGSITLQVPWEAAGPNAVLIFPAPTDSPFAPTEPITVLPAYPQFLAAPAGQSTPLGLAFIKSDWSGYLTAPPAPGDIVYAYMTGLGPVQIPVATGESASLTTPDPIAGSFACRFLPQQENAETLFAGLAPGTIGIYQVAFRMPADAGAPIAGIQCSYPGGGISLIGAAPGS